MVKGIFHTIRICSGSEFFPLRKVPIFKWGAIEKKRCLFQLSPINVRNFFSILAMSLVKINKIFVLKIENFLHIHQIKHVFVVLKRTFPSRWFF